jgi:hypothetical protein
VQERPAVAASSIALAMHGGLRMQTAEALASALAFCDFSICKQLENKGRGTIGSRASEYVVTLPGASECALGQFKPALLMTSRWCSEPE